jgi:hypothetical protein
MCTYTGTYQGNSFNFGKFLFLGGLVILGIITVQLNLHAFVAHTSEAEAVHQCFSRNGELQRWQNPDNGKFFRVCDNGNWFGIQVVVKNVDGTFREVTSFIRKTHNKFVTNLTDIERYLEIAGKAIKIIP